MQWTAPSGLQVELRPIRGAELIKLAEEAKGTDMGAIVSIVLSCVTEVLDPGPYKLTAAGRPERSQLLKGDLVAALLHLRAVSMPDGDVYPIDVRCPAGGCAAQFKCDVDLRELPLKTLDQEARDRLVAGLPFQGRAAGKDILFDLQCVAQDARAASWMRTAQRQRQTVIDTYAVQIREVEGLERNVRHVFNWLCDLDLGEIDEVRAVLEAPDCGVDTDVAVTCPQCEWRWTTTLPFGASFFRAHRTKPKRSQETTVP